MNSRDFDRFMPNVQADETGCWLWDGPRIAGYGNAWVEDKPMLAHRASYEHFIGPIPDGLEIDHLCEVKLCHMAANGYKADKVELAQLPKSENGYRWRDAFDVGKPSKAKKK